MSLVGIRGKSGRMLIRVFPEPVLSLPKVGSVDFLASPWGFRSMHGKTAARLYFDGHIYFVNVHLCEFDIAPCGFQVGMTGYLDELYQ